MANVNVGFGLKPINAMVQAHQLLKAQTHIS